MKRRTGTENKGRKSEEKEKKKGHNGRKMEREK
jgi:hypothetical protein